MKASSSTASAAVRRRILSRFHETLLSVSSFLEIQEEWMVHMTKASYEKFYVECITLCVQHIQLVLRRSLWLEAQLSLLQDDHGTPAHREYLMMLLQEPQKLLPPLAMPGELYGAAEKKGLLDEKTGRRLALLEQEYPVLLKNLFMAKALPEETLEQMARDLLHVDRECMKKLRELHIEGLKILSLDLP